MKNYFTTIFIVWINSEGLQGLGRMTIPLQVSVPKVPPAKEGKFGNINRLYGGNNNMNSVRQGICCTEKMGERGGGG